MSEANSIAAADAASPVAVSLIICTRNRAESLAKTLEALRHQALPDGLEWELLVVDNGSTDETAGVVDRAAIGMPHLRSVYEPRAGLSAARNCGLRHARGQAIAWTDDDVVPAPEWLARLTAPLLRDEADATLGTVQIPPDLVEGMRGTLLETRHGWVASTAGIDMESPERLVGANMAFHRRVLERVPAFDELLGAGPRTLGFGEETLFTLQLRASGLRLMGLPEAIVEHHFDLDRLTNQRVVSIAKRMAASEAYLDWHFRGATKTPPSWSLFKSRVKRRLRELLGQHRSPGTLGKWERELGYQYWQSYWREYARQSRGPRKYRPAGIDVTTPAP